MSSCVRYHIMTPHVCTTSIARITISLSFALGLAISNIFITFHFPLGHNVKFQAFKTFFHTFLYFHIPTEYWNFCVDWHIEHLWNIWLKKKYGTRLDEAAYWKWYFRESCKCTKLPPKLPWTLQRQRYPIHFLLVGPSSTFHSVSLYD